MQRWFGYQRFLKLPVNKGLRGQASSACSVYQSAVMSKLKNPSRLNRRLGCWDNPSGHKTSQCTQ